MNDRNYTIYMDNVEGKNIYYVNLYSKNFDIDYSLPCNNLENAETIGIDFVEMKGIISCK